MFSDNNNEKSDVIIYIIEMDFLSFPSIFVLLTFTICGSLSGKYLKIIDKHFHDKQDFKQG